MDEEKSIRWERYKRTITKARKKYLEDKKTVTVVFPLSEYEEIRSYCGERGYSLQGLIKETVLDRVRS